MKGELGISERADGMPVFRNVRDDEDFLLVARRLLADVLDGGSIAVGEVDELLLCDCLVSEIDDTVVQDGLVYGINRLRIERMGNVDIANFGAERFARWNNLNHHSLKPGRRGSIAFQPVP